MNLRTGLLRWMVLGLIFGVGLVLGIIGTLPDSNLHLVSCDVGQGDAILVFFKSSQILIDGGPNRAVIDCLSRHLPFWDRTIEVVVLTHPQADHLNGLIDVLERYDVEQVVVNGVTNNTAGFRALQEAVFSEGAMVHLPKRGDEIRIAPISLTALWPEERIGLAEVWKQSPSEAILGAATFEGEVNETSVVLQLNFGEFDALLTGDIGFPVEEELVSDAVLSRVEVLKVGHHGSKYASSEAFLDRLRPSLAIISAGQANRFGHPTAETLERLSSVGARVLRTDLTGDVEVVSDGKTYWVAE